MTNTEILICQQCKIEMVRHPLIDTKTLDLVNRRLNNGFTWACDKCQLPSHPYIHYFMELDEYLKRKSIEAWK